ncbi:hypothetical protein VAC51_00021 [Variovorax phage VAC_51]|nr:hypothetical protein VAC51_00021 [Variovorax phage VAC_51]
MPGIPASPPPVHPFEAPYGKAPTPNVSVPRKLHPMHSADFLSRQVLMTGCYPDTERCTGRTTVLALEFIAKAMSNPHVVVHVRDHHGTTFAHQRLVKVIHAITQRLGLEGFLCKPSDLTIEFTTPVSTFSQHY